MAPTAIFAIIRSTRVGAYDEYRQLLLAESGQAGWNYVDLWQAADNTEFTNTPIHLTAQGTLEFAEAIIAVLYEQFSLRP